MISAECAYCGEPAEVIVDDDGGEWVLLDDDDEPICRECKELTEDS